MHSHPMLENCVVHFGKLLSYFDRDDTMYISFYRSFIHQSDCSFLGPRSLITIRQELSHCVQHLPSIHLPRDCFHQDPTMGPSRPHSQIDFTPVDFGLLGKLFDTRQQLFFPSCNDQHRWQTLERFCVRRVHVLVEQQCTVVVKVRFQEALTAEWRDHVVDGRSHGLIAGEVRAEGDGAPRKELGLGWVQIADLERNDMG